MCPWSAKSPAVPSTKREAATASGARTDSPRVTECSANAAAIPASSAAPAHLIARIATAPRLPRGPPPAKGPVRRMAAGPRPASPAPRSRPVTKHLRAPLRPRPAPAPARRPRTPAARRAGCAAGVRVPKPARFARARAAGGLHAEAHRHPFHHDHRRRPHRHRPGLRVRLFRRPGLQGPPRGGFSRDPRQLEPRHDHDRPGSRRRHLHRAHHPPRSSPASSAWSAPDALLPTMGGQTGLNTALAGRGDGRARRVRGRDDRRPARRHRDGRGPRPLPRGDGAHRAGEPARHHRHRAEAAERQARRRRRARRRDGRHRGGRPARHHPPGLHARRHRRRRGLQTARITPPSAAAGSRRPPRGRS